MALLSIAVLLLAVAFVAAACGRPPEGEEAQGSAKPEGSAEGSAAAGGAEAVSGAARGAASGAPVGPEEELTPGEGTLVVYSGREQYLVEPIFEQFEERSGVDVQVRYGETAELASTILEEGENSPADLFFAQDPGALGALADAGALTELPQDIVDGVPERFRSEEDEWVGTSGRARVVAYNTEELSEEDLPDSILDFEDSEWSGRIGWAPTNGSFQAFVTALREVEGEGEAREWLEGIQANDPFVYPDNSTALEAVASGEVDVAFVNHYYLYQALEEQGEGFDARNYSFPGGDVGNLVIASGVGVLPTAENPEAAHSFAEYLLSEEVQRYFADETFEYPLAEGVEPTEGLKPLDEIETPEVDLGDLDDLQGTLELLQETGVL